MPKSIHCVVCSRRVRISKSGSHALTCYECVDLLQQKFSPDEIKALISFDNKRKKTLTTAVVARNHDEYIKWLCKNRLCSSDYEFVDLRLISIWNDPIQSSKERFIVLKGAKTIDEWKRFQSYAAEKNPTLILE